MPTTGAETFDDLAVQRLCRVFGAEQGRRIFQQSLEALGRTSLESADDLHAFAQLLSARGGMHAAVGGMLGVDAVLRGAVAPTKARG